MLKTSGEEVEEVKNEEATEIKTDEVIEDEPKEDTKEETKEFFKIVVADKEVYLDGISWGVACAPCGLPGFWFDASPVKRCPFRSRV